MIKYYNEFPELLYYFSTDLVLMKSGSLLKLNLRKIQLFNDEILGIFS
jgi:hypothetical protein